MSLRHFTAATCRALTAVKTGPSLYDICDPVLGVSHRGNLHLSGFYTTALRHPALRLLLRRAGLPELADCGRAQALTSALLRARDDVSPDWAAVGAPVAELLETIKPEPARPKPASFDGAVPDLADIEHAIRLTGSHLLRSFARNGFLPAYAAFNLNGDPDFGARELLTALTGLNARGYKNSTLLFNLARVFIARSPARDLINPPWTGVAEEMWQPVQIRHRSAYYDAFFSEALLRFIESGLADPAQTKAARTAVDAMVGFCIGVSREQVRSAAGVPFDVVTALAPLPHPRFSRYFSRIKHDLGFDIYVPDCDTTACAFSAATQAGCSDPVLEQPLLDFYAGYQVRSGDNDRRITLPLNDNIQFEGGIATWIDNLKGDRPFGNDLDPTLNLDVLEASFRNVDRWKVLETPSRLDTVHRILAFQLRLAESGAFRNPRSHIYYLPELYCAYFGRCFASFRTLPQKARVAVDPSGAFEVIKQKVLDYVQNELMAVQMNAFDAALALLALSHLGADVATFTPALACIMAALGEGGRRHPFKAYEWNKMKMPTRILVGGPEVTSAFVLMGLTGARAAMSARK